MKTLICHENLNFLFLFFGIQIQDVEKLKSTEVEEYELIIKETRKLIEVLKPHMTVSEVLFKVM